MTIGKKDYAIYDKSCLKEGDRLETEYKEDLGYQKTSKVNLILDNDKYYVVSFE